ncbi:MAG TPA: hypothetical protein VFH27_18410, partial [Longimicrobiaceae bacterium]|nr:hypothetical protein [Longimicrobiaceae bacterium]
MTHPNTKPALAALLAISLLAPAAHGQVLTVVPYARNLASASDKPLAVWAAGTRDTVNGSDLHLGFNVLQSEDQANSIWG